MIDKEKTKDILYDIIQSEINDIEGDCEGFINTFNGIDTDEIVKTILNGIINKFGDKIENEE